MEMTTPAARLLAKFARLVRMLTSRSLEGPTIIRAGYPHRHVERGPGTPIVRRKLH